MREALGHHPSCGMIDLPKRIRFDPGDESSVLTSVSDQCSKGKCESCPGIFQRDDYPGESIFCIHDCHKKTEVQQGYWACEYDPDYPPGCACGCGHVPETCEYCHYILRRK